MVRILAMPLLYTYVLLRVVFGLFFVMNLILWSKGSSGAVPFSTLVALLALWFGVSVPLTFVGAYFGFRKRVSINFSIQCHQYFAIRLKPEMRRNNLQ